MSYTLFSHAIRRQQLQSTNSATVSRFRCKREFISNNRIIRDVQKELCTNIAHPYMLMPKWIIFSAGWTATRGMTMLLLLHGFIIASHKFIPTRTELAVLQEPSPHCFYLGKISCHALLSRS